MQLLERIGSDAGDRPAVDRAGNGHRPAGTGVSGDGDRAVIGRVSAWIDYQRQCLIGGQAVVIGDLDGEIECPIGAWSAMKFAVASQCQTGRQ